MPKRPVTIGLLMGILAVLVFVGFSVMKGSRPDLAQAVTLTLACVGFVQAIHFIWIVLRAAPEDLGILSDYQVIIVIGAIAVIWISIEAAFKIFNTVLSSR